MSIPAHAQGAPTADVWNKNVGSSTLRLIDISLDALIAGGWSTQSDINLQNLQAGGHDPRKRGFTIQNVEISLTGAVDPYLYGEAHLIYFIDPLSGESIFELEEAWFITQALPYRLQVKGGQYFTEFGRINATHPHSWHFMDQPLINSRIFGPDGMRGPGARLSWLLPTPWYSDVRVGLQNANGETMTSFLSSAEFYEERGVGNRPFFNRSVDNLDDLVYLARWENGGDISENIASKIGISGLFGPNASGNSGRTTIAGVDIVAKWRPMVTRGGWPFVIFEAEGMLRDFKANSILDDRDPLNVSVLPKTHLVDVGMYAQTLIGFQTNWAAGVRYEYATAYNDSVGGTGNDPFRAERQRVSPLIMYRPTEFSRMRLQYNYDYGDAIADRHAHSVWLGAEFLYGSHAAHVF